MHGAHIQGQQSLLGATDLARATGGKRSRARKPESAGTKRRGLARALELVVEHGRKQARELGTTSLSKCPRCGHSGPTLTDFGTRVIRGERRPQSWCRACRAHALPPLTRPAEGSARTAKASRPAAEPSLEATSAEGWLFPPETLAARPPSRRKRSAPQHH
ncbi:hypothetical protein P2318_32645 [Myxococcaceae bacterium GXIMD 01537]